MSITQITQGHLGGDLVANKRGREKYKNSNTGKVWIVSSAVCLSIAPNLNTSWRAGPGANQATWVARNRDGAACPLLAAAGVAYGAGLRVSEVANLRVSDIGSKRMLIRVED